ncbi:MAG: hypothetical protein ACSLEM_05175 [Candidatus Malihini olakiniferum]
MLLIVILIAGVMLTGSGIDTAKYVVGGITKMTPMAAMFFVCYLLCVVTIAGMFNLIIHGILREVGCQSGNNHY